jgi:hypothetical protein
MNNTDPIRKSIIFLSVLCDKNRVSIKQELQDKHVTKKKEKKKKDKKIKAKQSKKVKLQPIWFL